MALPIWLMTTHVVLKAFMYKNQTKSQKSGKNRNFCNCRPHVVYNAIKHGGFLSHMVFGGRATSRVRKFRKCEILIFPKTQKIFFRRAFQPTSQHWVYSDVYGFIQTTHAR